MIHLFPFISEEGNRTINELVSTCPKNTDLTDIANSQWVKRASNGLMRVLGNKENALMMEKEIFTQKLPFPVLFLLSLKMVISKQLIQNIHIPFKVSIIFAVYKEHHRMLEKSQHPHGEDLITRKIKQLEWLFEESPQVHWELIIVDDGCPEKSGQIAEEIIKKKELKNVKVLYLQNAINKGLKISAPMQKTSESQKGGSIAFGMWSAAQESYHGAHIIIFIDADLSTHLGQTGLIIHPIIKEKKRAAIGSRREKESVVIKQGGRNHRGKLFIYLWKRMLPQLSDIVDTQCGFKAFHKNTVKDIIEGLIEKKFAFDLELLLQTELLESQSIQKVGIAWIYSEAASTTTDIQPYLPMLKAITLMQEKYTQADDMGKSFAKFIQSLSENDFQKLLQHIPKEIAHGEPADFDSFDKITIEDLKASAGLNLF